MTYRAAPGDGIAFVTGASSGIGHAVALELAQRGWCVAATARRAAELDALSTLSPGKIFAFPGDVTDRPGMAALIAAIEAVHGPVALAFLNAGTYYPDGDGPVDAVAVMRTFEVNVGGAVNCLDPLTRAMTARKAGQIAVNASVAGYGGLPNSTAYGATKAAIINMAASLKFTLDPANVRIQVVNPGFVRTPLTDRNDFPMPFMLELDDAARRVCDGFERGGFEIAFPRRLAWILKALNMLPYALYFPLVAKATGK